MAFSVKQAIEERRSIRSYLSTPVEEEKIRQLIEAARLAPSSENSQSWRFIIVRDGELKKQLGIAARHLFIEEAPVVLLGCATTERRIAVIDVAIACAYVTLQAQELGLRTCLIGQFDREYTKKVLNISYQARPILMILVGYSDYVPQPKQTKSFEEIVSYNMWGGCE